MFGGDVGLNFWFVDVCELMEEGYVGIVQGIGYLSLLCLYFWLIEIWESGFFDVIVLMEGWLGCYLDYVCECGIELLVGLQFVEEFGLILVMCIGWSQMIVYDGFLFDFDWCDLIFVEVVVCGFWLS